MLCHPKGGGGPSLPSEIIGRIGRAFDLDLDLDRSLASSAEKVDLLALCYSMGDGLTEIIRIEDAENRGS